MNHRSSLEYKRRPYIAAMATMSTPAEDTRRPAVQKGAARAAARSALHRSRLRRRSVACTSGSIASDRGITPRRSCPRCCARARSRWRARAGCCAVAAPLREDDEGAGGRIWRRADRGVGGSDDDDDDDDADDNADQARVVLGPAESLRARADARRARAGRRRRASPPARGLPPHRRLRVHARHRGSPLAPSSGTTSRAAASPRRARPRRDPHQGRRARRRRGGDARARRAVRSRGGLLRGVGRRGVALLRGVAHHWEHHPRERRGRQRLGRPRGSGRARAGNERGDELAAVLGEGGRVGVLVGARGLESTG